MKPLALACLLSLLLSPVSTRAAPANEAVDPSRLVLIGEDGKAQTVGALDLNGLPRMEAAVTHEGKRYGFRGVLVADLLKRVEASLGKGMRGPALSDVVIFTARDGYVVALPLSDLEPSIRDTKVILADATAEEAPLGDKDGPFRLLVDGDLKPARSERNVVKIELRRMRAAH